ncbi:MAG: tetratricopeptide repeat protein [Puniceicoccales bacterium]
MKTSSLSRVILVFWMACSVVAPVFSQASSVGASPDYGDQSSSTLTTKAWDALGAKNYALVDAYTNRCIELYASQAAQMQGQLTAPASAETAFEYWALNDVGTCYFIRGQALEAQGKDAEAVAAYKTLIAKYKFAQTWDTKGWFWQPASAAKQRLQVLEFAAL